MRLKKARVQKYRSIIDTGIFEIERLKTIMVGPNEAGKTVLLQALQQLNKPSDVIGFDPLRDYPRSLYNDITTGRVKNSEVAVVTGYFELEDKDKELIPEEYHNCIFKIVVNLDNNKYYSLENVSEELKYIDISKDIKRLLAHLDEQYEGNDLAPSEDFHSSFEDISDTTTLSIELSGQIKKFINDKYSLIDENNQNEEGRYDKLIKLLEKEAEREYVLKTLEKHVPVFVLFNNYTRVKPSIHLEHLAIRTEKGLIDDKYFDYGNLCLLKLLGFSARSLSDLGKTQVPDMDNHKALKEYKDKLDTRSYQLNAASIRLSEEITNIWNPNPDRSEADKIKISADGQYLKVVVEDSMGVDIELDQRSEGFQWLVSFYIVFFAEAIDKHKNAILLLDEPGMSLHGLKQREFRGTISSLAKNNQVIYTTHSPFLVGPEELDLVRVVELRSRSEGTKVHTTITSSDPAGLLPLQEALGYDLAQSLFSQQRNLILEGITDYWYIEATAELLRNAGIINLNEKIALVFANSAGKVVYYATILHAHRLKVAALLDSDSAGDKAAQQETLVHTLGNNRILRTKDFVDNVKKPEIEDLLRNTLINVAKDEYGVNVTEIANSQETRPIVDILNSEINDFSKYRLAKAYVRWTRENDATDLDKDEMNNFCKIINKINNVLE